jgi:hypothetical protein
MNSGLKRVSTILIHGSPGDGAEESKHGDAASQQPGSLRRRDGAADATANSLPDFLADVMAHSADRRPLRQASLSKKEVSEARAGADVPPAPRPDGSLPVERWSWRRIVDATNKLRLVERCRRACAAGRLSSLRCELAEWAQLLPPLDGSAPLPAGVEDVLATIAVPSTVELLATLYVQCALLDTSEDAEVLVKKYGRYCQLDRIAASCAEAGALTALVLCLVRSQRLM